jgi:SAM-dependent methyltransferase
METEIVIREVEEIESRSGNVRYVVRDADGREYVTFRARIGREARRHEGRRARISYHEEDRGGFHNVYLDEVSEPTAGHSTERAVEGSVERSAEGSAETADGGTDRGTGKNPDEAGWDTAVEAAPWLVGTQEPTEAVPPERLYERLRRSRTSSPTTYGRPARREGPRGSRRRLRPSRPASLWRCPDIRRRAPPSAGALAGSTWAAERATGSTNPLARCGTLPNREVTDGDRLRHLAKVRAQTGYDREVLPKPEEGRAMPESDPLERVSAQYPNSARIWNYHLGGKDNFAIDREAAEAANAMAREIGTPTGAEAAREGRHLLQRMVDFMASQGIRQFLDLGSGFPNMANTHQIAHRVDPGARVIYVDLDPVVSTHQTALMAGPNVLTLNADLRVPEQVLRDPQVREMFDFDQPIGILFICMLHCLWDKEDPWGVVRRFRDAVAPGSHLALSHLINEGDHREAAEALFEISKNWSAPLIGRSREDIARFFDGFDLVEPGLVAPAQWRPELHNPLLVPTPGNDEGEPIVGNMPAERLTVVGGVVSHLCGVGKKVG